MRSSLASRVVSTPSATCRRLYIEKYRETTQSSCIYLMDGRRHGYPSERDCRRARAGWIGSGRLGPLQVDRALERDARRAAGDARRLDHADRDARHLPRHPPRSARAGQQLLPAVDDPRLPRRDERADRQPRAPGRHVRPREDVQPRLRHLHARVAGADRRLAERARRRYVPDRLSHRAGRRRGVPAGELGGDHHRRVPRQPARHGARHQQHRRRQRHVRRARARRPVGADRLAAGVPDLGAGRAVRHRVGLPEARGAQHAQTRACGLVGQRHLRARADPDHGLGHLRHSPLRQRRRPAGAARACSRCSARASRRWSSSR